MRARVHPLPIQPADRSIQMNTLVEQLWHDFNGRVPRDQIRQVAAEVATRFWDAKVTTYIPLLIRRYTRERLEYAINTEQE